MGNNDRATQPKILKIHTVLLNEWLIWQQICGRALFLVQSIIDLPNEGHLIRALTFSHGVGLICASTRAKLRTAFSK